MTVTDYLMCSVIGCVVLIGATYRIRRDVTGPAINIRTEITWWSSFGILVLWVGMDWLADSHDRWFTTMRGAATLAAVEFVCLVAMLLDTLRVTVEHGRVQRDRPGRHHPK